MILSPSSMSYRSPSHGAVTVSLLQGFLIILILLTMLRIQWCRSSCLGVVGSDEVFPLEEPSFLWRNFLDFFSPVLSSLKNGSSNKTVSSNRCFLENTLSEVKALIAIFH